MKFEIDYINHPIDLIQHTQSAALLEVIGILRAESKSQYSPVQRRVLAKELLEYIHMKLSPILAVDNDG